MKYYSSTVYVPRRRHEAEQRQRRDGLAAARFTDHAQGASGLDRIRDAVDRAHLAALARECDRQLAHLEKWGRPGGGRLYSVARQCSIHSVVVA